MTVVKLILVIVSISLLLNCSKQPMTVSESEGSARNGRKALINPFDLVGKSIADVENVLGKPSYSERRPAEYFKEEEFRHYTLSGIRELQIDYASGKVDGIWINLEEANQSKKPEDVLRRCGLNLKISDAKLEPLGDYWWKDAVDAKPFNSVHLVKFKDSGIFYQCHAFVSKSKAKP